MPNYKLLLPSIFILITGCVDNTDHFFYSIQPDKQTGKITYSSIHNLTLDISEVSIAIVESGFSPSLNAAFSLTNTQKNPWPQAWVAFMINISIKDKLLASITRSDSLHEHSLKVSVNQELPTFGIKKEDIHVDVQPISWMPTYPLMIQASDSAIK